MCAHTYKTHINKLTTFPDIASSCSFKSWVRHSGCVYMGTKHIHNSLLFVQKKQNETLNVCIYTWTKIQTTSSPRFLSVCLNIYIRTSTHTRTHTHTHTHDLKPHVHIQSQRSHICIHIYTHTDAYTYNLKLHVHTSLGDQHLLPSPILLSFPILLVRRCRSAHVSALCGPGHLLYDA